MKKLVRFLSWVFLSGFIFPAFAFEHVIDTSNLAQNTISAIYAVQQEINTASILKEQIETKGYALRSTASLGSLSSLTSRQKEASLYSELALTDSSLLNALMKSRELNSNLLALFGASDVPFEKFLTDRAANRKNREDALLRSYETNQSEIRDVASRRQAIVQKLESATGQTQALQAVGSAIDVLIGQNQQVLSAMTAASRASLSEKTDEQASQNASKLAWNAYQKRLRDASGKVPSY